MESGCKRGGEIQRACKILSSRVAVIGEINSNMHQGIVPVKNLDDFTPSVSAYVSSINGHVRRSSGRFSISRRGRLVQSVLAVTVDCPCHVMSWLLYGAEPSRKIGSHETTCRKSGGHPSLHLCLGHGVLCASPLNKALFRRHDRRIILGVLRRVRGGQLSQRGGHAVRSRFVLASQGQGW